MYHSVPSVSFQFTYSLFGVVSIIDWLYLTLSIYFDFFVFIICQWFLVTYEFISVVDLYITSLNKHEYDMFRI